eukprot:CAMPEP_0197585278 /NCGR_PEP_ID=MMETSP1326-20131121/7625_1 /TAXON_ID=1155430 /ORGANISM="Genus nov. species nov., Strain RCC2288" /LENGTH=68 /DNA_ID=CAMNT_0043149753 /DNA_START=300 /DNA_END=506 /DNA_ORIENTATION=+
MGATETVNFYKARGTGNYAIAATLMVFVGGTYYYAMHRVRSKDAIDVAIDNRTAAAADKAAAKGTKGK